VMDFIALGVHLGCWIYCLRDSRRLKNLPYIGHPALWQLIAYCGGTILYFWAVLWRHRGKETTVGGLQLS